MSELIDFIYDEATLKTLTAGTLQEKAIVCPKNDTAGAVNAKILSSIGGSSKIYLINDEAIPICRETSETEMLYPMEYLNTMAFPGFPPYELELKVGSPIMLLRNVNLSGGLCDIKRMIIRQSRKMSEPAIASLRIGEENCILEAKVYQNWISKSVPDMKQLAFCCILIDKENNAIQANIDLNNIDYFNPGHVVEFIMWNVVAKGFNKETIEKLAPTVIIAISSCRVTKYRVDDILDIQTAVETQHTGAMLATSSFATTEESTEKSTDISGVALSISSSVPGNDSNRKDKSILE
ncbi:DNA helicase [Tanacetum coccineum]